MTSNPSSDPPPPALRTPILGRGTILAVLSERLVTVEMQNGYEVRAYWPSSETQSPPEWVPGNRISLEFSPYDMSQARILPEPV